VSKKIEDAIPPRPEGRGFPRILMKIGFEYFSQTGRIVALTLFAGPLLADTGSGRQIVTIPDPVSPCQTYQIRSGDSLGAIAKRVEYAGINVKDIFEANRDRLSSPDLLRAGVEIRIPCAPGETLVPVLGETETPVFAVAPLWEAASGEGLVPVLIRWGHEAGFDVIVELGGNWRFGVPFLHNGSFRGAVDEVLSGFSTAAAAPYVTFYTNNVMTIGAR